MKLKAGTKVLIEVEIVERARDNRPLEKCGYLIRTSRDSKAYVEPSDIWQKEEK